MEITDVQIRLVRRPTDRLRAFCNVTFDEEFVIRDMKIVDGANGLFVAMPSRKVTAGESDTDGEGRSRQYRDIAHPITTSFREKLQQRILEAYEDELAAAKAQGTLDHDEPDEEVDEAKPTRAAGGRSGGSRRGATPSAATEYDELIAGLRGRPLGGSDRGGESRSSGGEGRGRGREGGGRDRGGRDAGSRSAARSSDSDRGGSGKAVSERGGRGQRRGEDAKPARREDASKSGGSARRSSSPPPAEEPIDLTEPTVETEIDNGGFGAGIFDDTAAASGNATSEKSSKPPTKKRPSAAARSAAQPVEPEKATPPPPADEVELAEAAEETESEDAREGSQAFGAGIL